MSRLTILAALCALILSCKGSPEAPPLSWHAEVQIKAPIAAVEARCGGRRCALEHPRLDSIEYGADASGRIKAVLVRFKLPPERSVQASRDLFTAAREQLKVGLGDGKTYLASGDPTYWPERDPNERVVTLTVDEEERPVLAIGAIGPGADKLPPGGAAGDLGQVQRWWDKISPLLDGKKP
jgi:hypothetical protein